MWTVGVNHTWKGTARFEFETEDEANAFHEAVEGGDLNAIVDAGDIDTSAVELTDFGSSGRPKETTEP